MQELWTLKKITIGGIPSIERMIKMMEIKSSFEVKMDKQSAIDMLMEALNDFANYDTYDLRNPETMHYDNVIMEVEDDHIVLRANTERKV